jgi:hypothetical protein
MNIIEVCSKINNKLKSEKKFLENWQKIIGRKENFFRLENIENKQDYAFNYDGRKRIQFNIGFDDKKDFFRYGLAFSFQDSQSVKKEELIKILYPKVEKFILTKKINIFWFKSNIKNIFIF